VKPFLNTISHELGAFPNPVFIEV